MRRTLYSILLAWAMFALPANTSAAIFEMDGRVQIIFEGKVQYRFDDTFEVRNPDGSTTQFSSDDLARLRLSEGDTAQITLSFDVNDRAFGSAGCNGRYALGFAGSGSCTLDTKVETPFGNAGFGGIGGDDRGGISGLVVLRDQATGELSLDAPSGNYSIQYVEVPNYLYDSATGTLSGPGFPCISAFNCADDTFFGNLSSISFPLDITGDFGLVRPGFNVGYNAGRAGYLDIVGGFNTGNTPTPVPAPGMLFIFMAVLAAIGARKKLAAKPLRPFSYGCANAVRSA